MQELFVSCWFSKAFLISIQKMFEKRKCVIMNAMIHLVKGSCSGKQLKNHLEVYEMVDLLVLDLEVQPCNHNVNWISGEPIYLITNSALICGN